MNGYTTCSAQARPALFICFELLNGEGEYKDDPRVEFAACAPVAGEQLLCRSTATPPDE
jgi:hypothetical protein